MLFEQDLLELAVSLAHAAGDMALAGRKQGLQNIVTKSTATDMVTEFDKACEVLITDGIRRARPSDGIVGEEGARQESASGITWHIDPIDGTTNFFFDLPTWAVSIAAVDHDGSLVGVVYIPALNETFTAIRHQGAFLNGQPISVRKNPLLSDALVCTGFSYSAQKRVVQAQRIPIIIEQVRDLRRFGAAAIDLCFVACGRFDAYFEENLMSWDLAAGQLIATEAGAIVTDFSGNTVHPSEVLASQPHIHHELSALILRASK
ncbi:MAG: inositol monophosphatase [Ilumatobacteraceae bacterium]|nr:inositol monophosphatase [Ilumatobacteraceae bacterium]